MGYPYEDMDDGQFERLVVQCMKKLFGLGVQAFAAGPDGGRDARFHGTAERFPSASAPWVGITVAQAKHTNGINAHYSDGDFSGDIASAVLTEEVKRLDKLRQADEVDNYIVFSNRRLGGVAGPAIVKRLAKGSGLDKGNIFLAGIEYLDDMLHTYPDLIALARIDPIDGPLVASSHELAEVILAIALELKSPISLADAAVVDRVSYDEKNLVNNMTPEYAKTIKKLYLNYSSKIMHFLADPSNVEVLRMYEGAVEEFQLKIVAKRKSFQTFDDVFNYLFDLLVRRDGVLARNRRLTRAMLFYMYWHCDIGETPDAASE